MCMYTFTNRYICVYVFSYALLTKSNNINPLECAYKWFARQINVLFTDTQLLAITE